MATRPTMQSVRALTIGLGLVCALLAGPIALDTPTASADPSPGIVAVDDPGLPPGPGPTPDIQAPGAPGPAPAAPPVHRRHIDGDPMIER